MTAQEEIKQIAKDLVAYRITQIQFRRNSEKIERRKEEFKNLVNSSALQSDDQELNKFLMFTANIDDYTDDEVLQIGISSLK
ncbi:hypothetical protein [Leeuwenhoekiella marinoflava]|uniref:Uncharacterized protein n=2 Tax=Leeuwenhoekiella marinoflava TaxID=988 RepID=A0A4Q0PMP3_9FLAO|nr:hypothetical protein [Leeuwenhoekiella marinoflava]RXG31806.1 hypothetical protein DSL99_1630 [Leeuwenhoekiella marinoflava]SHF04497.1 hypothetical protein SAMN02745246_01552 [Leeuwenhoekiella marinoflava DSM 3653]